MIPMEASLDAGRSAYARQRWADAYTGLSTADAQATLEAEDLELLAVACQLLSKDDEGCDVWARAYHARLERGEDERAARCAFWLALLVMNKGEMARGGGWLARADQLVNDGSHDCVEQGFLLIPAALGALMSGEAEAAAGIFAKAGEIAARFADRDLAALARLGRGQSLATLGRPTEALPFFDEIMVAITAREVNPIVTGIAYCAAIEAFRATFDLGRAKEWTAALTEWCASQPDLVPFRGQCLVYRAEIMQLEGEWPGAIQEATRAREWLSRPPGPAMGMALYQLGELYRLRGEFSAAEEAYREANQWGHSPQPGMALLRFAQGQVDAAQASIRRVVEESHDLVTRSKVLPAFVEIMLAAGETIAAREAADELSKNAETLDAPLLHALATQAAGAVSLAEGNGSTALVKLRSASTAWQALDALYDTARVRVLIGLACRLLGDEDGAAMELDAARRVFRELGAATDLTRLEELSAKPASKQPAGGLTTRELEVLRLVASGKTNRAIAQHLVISEKTVARHVANIFTKVGLSSRAEATAYAYQHGLV